MVRLGKWHRDTGRNQRHLDHSTMSDSDLEGYFQGVWIFILPLFIFFLVLGLLA